MKIWNIAVKNIKTLFRDKTALLMMILVPIFFYSLMGFVFGGLNTDDPHIYNVGWVDLDSTSSEHPYLTNDNLYELIDDVDNIKLIKFETNATAFDALDSQDIDCYIVIPDGFELYIAGMGSKPSSPLEINYRGGTNEISRNIITGTIIGTIDGIVNFDPDAKEIDYTEEAITGKALNEITIGTPGYLMYGILGSLSGAVILITQEKKDGLLKRLETSRMTSRDMLGGHLISNTVIVFIQFGLAMGVLSLFGFSPSTADVGSLIAGSLITLLILSIFQNALALVAAAIFKTPDASAGGIWLLLIPLLTFSGAFFPLEFVAPSLIPYVGWIPTRIAVVLFQSFMVDGASMWSLSILSQWGILFLQSVALFALGLILYKRFVRSP